MDEEQKKVITLEQGKRLRLCRNYTGYNIKDFCEKYNFSEISFGRWERGVNPLTIKNSEKICNSLLREGILCEQDWLLYGKGAPPSEIGGPTLLQSSYVLQEVEVFSALVMFSEIEIFQKDNIGSMLHMIDTIAMKPFFEIGDYVGGICLPADKYELAHEKNCIIKLPDTQKIMVRYVSFKNGKMVLETKNPDFHCLISMPLELSDFPEIVAPIIYHRKPTGWVYKKVDDENGENF